MKMIFNSNKIGIGRGVLYVLSIFLTPFVWAVWEVLILTKEPHLDDNPGMVAVLALGLTIASWVGSWWMIRKHKKKHALPSEYLVTGSLMIIFGFFVFSQLLWGLGWDRLMNPDGSFGSETKQLKECLRTSPYPREPVIDAALGLLLRAHGDTRGGLSSVLIDGYGNCLNIHFANNDSEMFGAEGVFFSRLTPDLSNIEIVVSPRYRDEDASLVALLLEHELTHAFFYTVRTLRARDPEFMPSFKDQGCATEEAVAFLLQSTTLTALPEYALEQVKNRIVSSWVIESDPEVEAFAALLVFQGKHNLGDSPDPLGLLRDEFVLKNPAYIEQCGE